MCCLMCCLCIVCGVVNMNLLWIDSTVTLFCSMLYFLFHYIKKFIISHKFFIVTLACVQNCHLQYLNICDWSWLRKGHTRLLSDLSITLKGHVLVWWFVKLILANKFPVGSSPQSDNSRQLNVSLVSNVKCRICCSATYQAYVTLKMNVIRRFNFYSFAQNNPRLSR